MSTRDVVDSLNARVGGPPELRFPDKWTLSTSWQRAQSPAAVKNPINPAEWMIQIDGGDRHRVTFALLGGDLIADCDCDGFRFEEWCAHVAHMWWSWVRSDAVVTDLDADRSHELPPVWLEVSEERSG